MKFSEAKQGRTFIIRLEDGDVVHECIEEFSAEHDVKAASLIVVGGADSGSRLIVGPEKDRSQKVVPMEHELTGAHEIAGAGTLFPDSKGKPVLHMHVACGRAGQSVTGCVRAGVNTWNVMEVIIQELIGTDAKRIEDPATGFELLEP